jgi:hypothetical protein
MDPLIAAGASLARSTAEGAAAMSQGTVGIVVERLLNEEDFRVRLALEPFETLADLSFLGIELTGDEIDVFIQTDVRVWFWSSAMMREVH